MNSYIKRTDSRFAYDDEIKDSSFGVNLSDNKEIKKGGPVLLKENETIYMSTKDIHTLIVGSTGSMKTRRCVMPMINLLIKSGESLIVNDPKGELYKMCKSSLEKEKYKTIVLNLRDPIYGDRWNPLGLPYKLYREGEKDKANSMLEDLANSIFFELASNTDDAYWTSVAKKYFVGIAQILFEYGKEEQINFKSMCMIDNKGFDYAEDEYTDSEMVYREFYNIVGKDSINYLNMSTTINAPSNTRECIRSVFNASMSIFSSQEGLSDMLSGNDFDLRSIGKEKTAIFIIAPDEKTIYNSIITAFIKQIYTVLIDEADEYNNLELPVRVNFVLEEFGNIPKLQDIHAMLTAARSRNIRFHLVVQSANQLYAIYGKEATEILMGNCDLWIYLNSKDLPLLNKISELCGKYKSEYTNEEAPLLSVSKLQRFSKEKGQALILYERNYPYITYLPDILEYNFDIDEKAKIRGKMRKKSNNLMFDIKSYVENELLKINNNNEHIKTNLQEENEFDELNDIFENSYDNETIEDEELNQIDEIDCDFDDESDINF